MEGIGKLDLHPELIWILIPHTHEANHRCVHIEIHIPGFRVRGLIHKRPHPTDGRLLELTLTDQGRQMVSEMAPLAHAYQAELMAELGEGATLLKQQLCELSKRSE